MAKKYQKLSGILKKLLFQKDIRAADLCREIDVPAPTIHRLITGKSTRPYKSSLKPIADYFDVSIEQLIGEEPLPADLDQAEPTKKRVLSSHAIKQVPIVPWEQLLTKLPEKKEGVEKETIPFLGHISEKGFATIMPDSSMEPVFSRGSLLIFDPCKQPKDRSFVLTELHESKIPVFRQLLVDLDHQYLKPLNPDLNAFKMRLLDNNDTIRATLVEARRIYEDI